MRRFNVSEFYRVELTCPHCGGIHGGASSFGDKTARDNAEKKVEACKRECADMRLVTIVQDVRAVAR